uniref:CHK domain-containing protein n=1 Tax=Musca domestica TaxID=7370 RepID=A0A1I8MJL6_MUSDO
MDNIGLHHQKTPPMPEQIFEAVSFKALFNNEILAYEKIIPALEKFGGVSLNTARYYYGILNNNSAIVITEDFGANGWQLTEDKFGLCIAHTLMAVKYLAKFHALGFAMSHTNKEQFTQLTEGLMESRYGRDEVQDKWAMTLECGLERVIQRAKEYFEEIPEQFLENFRELLTQPMAYGRQLVKPKEPYITLCHGDYLRNNVAYKYGKGAGISENTPLDIMMFDLQTLRVSSPMFDLTFFLALSTVTDIRQPNYDQIFKTYCQNLKENYEKFAKQPLPQYLSPDALIREYIRFLPHSILITSAFLLEMVEPHGQSGEQMLNAKPTREEVFQDIMHRGGDIVDYELANQMLELYQLATQYNVDVFAK